ncbi:hypothetical protein ACRAR1_13735 [Streptomyces sanyensis]|uniref:hypothetical protein n=1 Tax=Streptomyces sanyensis TaxID=568869 RepID=UPI003D777911
MRAQGQGWGMGEREPFDTGEGGTPADHTAAKPSAPAPDAQPVSAARGAAVAPGAASPPGSPSLPRAADDPRTAAALHAYRRRARYLLLAGPGLGALGVALAMAGGIAERVVFLAFVLCVTSTGIGIGSLLVGRRMAAALAAGPWQVREARSAPSGLHAAAAILRDPATGGCCRCGWSPSGSATTWPTPAPQASCGGAATRCAVGCSRRPAMTR